MTFGYVPVFINGGSRFNHSFQGPFLNADVFIRAQGTENFKSMLLMGDNKVQQYIASAATDPSTKDEMYDECVEIFTKGVAAFRELSKTGRTTMSGSGSLTKSAEKAPASSSSKKESSGTKVRFIL